MKTVLIAEDEKTIRELIAVNLRFSGYNTIEACDGRQAVEIFSKNSSEIDIVLLDIMMPELDGINACRKIRKENINVGIIFLSAKTQESDKIDGFASGADDYITKPFSPSELIARIETLYRRVEYSKKLMQINTRDKIILGDYTLNLNKHCVLHKGETIELTQTEFQILECFFSRPDTPIDRKEILDTVWGDPYFGDDKVVDVNIRRLRIKLEENPSAPRHLITVWGQGYCWKE